MVEGDRREHSRTVLGVVMSMSRLVVAFGANEQWDITGSEEDLHAQYTAIHEALEATDGTGKKFFEFIGLRNLADRNPEQMILRLDEIRGVDVQEL